MKDFTKTQSKREDVQGKTGALKCNRCNTVVNAFGVHPGDPCVAFPALGQPQASEGGSTAPGRCTGKYMKIDDKSADNAKRRTDGAA
jgi:hypothetical protein